MHMAAIHRTPCVAIFSEVFPIEKWHPRGENHIVLRADVACSGCMLEEYFAEPSYCMLKIGVEDVVAAVKRKMNFVN